MTHRKAQYIRPGMVANTRNPRFRDQPVISVATADGETVITFANGADRRLPADYEVDFVGGEYTLRARQPRELRVGDRVVHHSDHADAGTVIALAEHKGHARGSYQSPGALKVSTVYVVSWDSTGPADARYFRRELAAIVG